MTLGPVSASTSTPAFDTASVLSRTPTMVHDAQVLRAEALRRLGLVLRIIKHV
jgi:hypothetical protein